MSMLSRLGAERQGHVDLDLLTCMECGVKFGIDADYHDVLQKQQGGCEPDSDEEDEDSEEEVKRGWFACPNGHKQRYHNNVLKVTEDLLVKTSHRAEQAEAKVATLTEKLKRVEADRDKYEGMYTRLAGSATRSARVSGDTSRSKSRKRCASRSK